MTGEEFSIAIHKAVIERNFNRYHEQLRTASRDVGMKMAWGSPNPWGMAVRAWDTFNNDQRDAFLQFIRMVMIETTANIFSVLDGSAVLSGVANTMYRDAFVLLYGPYDAELSKRPDRLEDITDYFLVAEQGKTHSLWPENNTPAKAKSTPKPKLKEGRIQARAKPNPTGAPKRKRSAS